jgi:hypothetical protein
VGAGFGVVGAGVGVGVGVVTGGVLKTTVCPVDVGFHGHGLVPVATEYVVAYPAPHWQYSFGTLSWFGAALQNTLES